MQGRTEVLFSVLNAGLVNAILWRFYPVWVTVLWLGVFILVHLERIRMRADYRSASAALRAEPRWRRRLEENGFWAGCLWGAVASVFILTRDPAVHAFVVFVLGGMAAGAVIVTAADLPTMCAFMAACVVIPVAILLTRGAAADIRLGSMLAIFAVALAMMGCAIHAWIVQNLRLRMTQDRLAADLLASQSAMEEAEAIAEVGRWDSDAPSGVITWSDEMYRIFGVERSNFTPSVAAIRGRVHPDDRVDAKWQHEPATESGSRKGVVHRLVMDDGTVKYVHQQSRIDHDAAGAIVRIHGTVQDITEQKSLEARLEFNATVLRAEIESSESGGMVVDAEGSMILFNSKVAEIWGISIADLEANDERGALQSVASIIVNRKAFEQRIQHLYEHPEEDSHDELQTVDGRTIERYTVSLRDDREKYLGRAWFFTDVTERLRAEALALRSARADVLTGLANRGVFIEALEQAIGGARRGGAGFAVIYLDLDHFKDVNDGLGHAAGDLLLTVAADRMRATIREVDTLARFGGDEFALLAAHISDPATAAGLADKLIKVLSEPFEIAGRRVVAGASAGIDIYGPGSDQAETLLGHADIALYQAKADGRGRYRFFTPAIDIETRARVTLGGELREAIDADQLFLVYQPQVGLENCHVCGVEALVRWNHPTRGLLGPYLFIPLAE
jgi:diguanylate cyclase (GGDEF)-like protein/PAS domain S-box-containing protein